MDQIPILSYIYIFFQSSFKVKLGNSMLENFLVRNIEYCHTDATQTCPTEDECEW